jgi:phosphomannomutase/phosphoglucomutase
MIADGDLYEGSGSITQADIIPDYVRTVAGLTHLARPLTIVVDSGNGMAGGIAPEVFRAIGAEVTELFSESDPTFPNHFPDPTIPAYMRDLQECVRSTGADLGVAFDADADRLGVVDPTGRIVWGDMLLALLFREVAATHQGSPVIVEVKCSQATYEDVAAHGGKPLFWKTGHAFIEAKMHETHAVVAGEMSGHLYFGDEYQPYDDGIYAGARVARMVAAGTRPLDALVDDLPRYEATPELRVHCADETKFAIIDDVVRKLGARYPGSFTLDGIRVAFPHGWALARCSNTSPRIIVRAEGRTATERDEYLRVIRDELAKHEGVDISALDQCLAGEEVTHQ